jgi:hypothetical protein
MKTQKTSLYLIILYYNIINKHHYEKTYHHYEKQNTSL